MDLYELSKQLGNKIIITYDPKTDGFTAELEGACTVEIQMRDVIGRSKCRKDALRSLADVVRGKDVYGTLGIVKVPDDIKIPTGL